MSDEILTQQRLKELFDYDGHNLIWKIDKGSRAKAGDVAGCFDFYGYRVIQVDGKSHKAHRLIWLMIHGIFPHNEIDHINGIPSDNHIENLRAVDRQTNCRNAKKLKNNKSGITGVFWNKQHKKWIAQIRAGGNHIYLGQFDCKWRAASIRQLAESVYGGFTQRHGN